jgi:hypothetical protein
VCEISLNRTELPDSFWKGGGRNLYKVETVENRQQEREFMDLIWRLYKGDPNWVPPLRQNQEELVGFHNHPFYERNLGRAFIVRRNNQVVGRIVAIINYGHNERFQERRGFFGFFDCENDKEAARLLFAKASDFLRTYGMTDVRGPCNPSLNYELGLLVDGFTTPPTFMMTYNAPYYEQLITNLGFEKSQDMYAFEGEASMLKNLDPKLYFVIEEVKRRFNVTVRKADPRNLLEEAKLFVKLYNEALISTWGFVPMSPAEAEHTAEGLRLLLDPDLTTIVQVDGRPVGVVLGLLDYNPIIKKIDGRLFPFGFLHLLFGRKSIKRIRMVSNNILPEFQRWGLGLVAADRLTPDCLARGIHDCEFSWVLESNQLSRGSLERGGARRTKTYRLYDRSLEKPF